LWIEGSDVRERWASKPRRELRRLRATAHALPSLEDDNVSAALGEKRRRHEGVVPRTYDDNVSHCPKRLRVFVPSWLIMILREFVRPRFFLALP